MGKREGKGKGKERGGIACGGLDGLGFVELDAEVRIGSGVGVGGSPRIRCHFGADQDAHGGVPGGARDQVLFSSLLFLPIFTGLHVEGFEILRCMCSSNVRMGIGRINVRMEQGTRCENVGKFLFFPIRNRNFIE